MVHGRGGELVRDADLRATARERAHEEAHIPPDGWGPPAMYANNPKKWWLERCEQVKDPVLREALRRQPGTMARNRIPTDPPANRRGASRRPGAGRPQGQRIHRGGRMAGGAARNPSYDPREGGAILDEGVPEPFHGALPPHN